MAYARLATRNTSGLHPTFRGLGLLGDTNPTLTPEAAMQQAIQQTSSWKLNPRDFQNSAWLSKAEQQISAGQFDVSWYSPSCAGQQAPPLNLFSTASGLAISTAAAGTGIAVATGAITATTGALLGAATMGAGLIISVIGMIFAHHAAAVKRDLQFGCSALPAVNNAFALISQAVRNGQTTPDAAASALDQIETEFHSAGGAAINYSPWCNSNCEMEVVLKGMILYWKAQYQAMAAQAAAAAAAQMASEQPVSQTASQPAAVVSSSGGSQIPEVVAGIPPSPASGISAIPVWAWFLAAAFGLWAVA
jgi:hypothetical protein